jgi:hypothetical protein
MADTQLAARIKAALAAVEIPAAATSPVMAG